jgi:hypothetical protein
MGSRRAGAPATALYYVDAARTENVVTHDRPHVIKGKVISGEIVKRVDLTPEHFKIWLRCSEPFTFAPGQ